MIIVIKKRKTNFYEGKKKKGEKRENVQAITFDYFDIVGKYTNLIKSNPRHRSNHICFGLALTT